MKYCVSYFLFACFIFAGYFFLRILLSKERKYTENRMLAIFCISSAIWSLGFCRLILQTEPDMAYYCRSFGMIGVILYLIMAQELVCYISQIRLLVRRYVNVVSLMGIFIYFLVIQKSQVVYRLEDMGMTYYFKPGFCNNLYTLYCVVVAADILGISIYMIRSKTKRIKAFGRKFMLVEAIIVTGMVLDTIFPLVGLAAIPGSTVTQFFGMVVIYRAVYAISRSRINISNMSEYIYYSMAVPVMVYDAGYRLCIMNDAAVSFLDTDRETMEREKVSLDDLFETQEENVFDFQGKNRDIDAISRNNQLYCSLAVSKINDSYGDIIGYIIFVTDLSEHRRAMKQLEEAVEETRAANQAKSTFLANMSHEIRTPMNAIIGFSELVLKMDIEPLVREYVEDIKGSSNNLLAIINDILDISKIESGKMELVCSEYYTASLFNDVYLIIDTQAKKKGLRFTMKIDTNIPNKLYGDKVRIRGVLINLLNNAVKYTQKGSISFEAGIENMNGDNLVLFFKVQDTGIGIKPEEQQKMFESFSQVDRKMNYGVEGSGLGLTIAKGYVNLMGGDILVQSEYGKGSLFTATIRQKIIDASPMDKTYAREDAVLEEFRIGSMKVSGVKALLVDDNQVNLKVADSSLRHYGMEVDMADSGMEAIRLCKENQYPLIFMDQMMPQMDGTEAMKEIRKISSFYADGGQCKIIVLTANAITGAREELMAEGFDEYLEKPMNFKSLENILIRFLPSECIHVQEEEKTDTKEDNGAVSASESVQIKETKTLQEILTSIEVERGLLNCGGDFKNYLNILQLTFRNGEKQLEELNTLLKGKNYADYTIKIHALKGMALSVGAADLAAVAKQLEQAGKNGENSYIDVHTEEFSQAYRKLLGQMKMALVHYQMLEDEAQCEQNKSLQEQDIRPALLKIKQCMDEFDFAGASGLVREALDCPLADEDRKIIENIGRLVDEVDTESIQEIMNSYLQQ